MSNELVPEQRVNKLGHVVTKHVRSSSPAVVSRRSIPAVSVSGGGESVRAQWAADAEVFSGIKALQKAKGFAEVHDGILSGVIRLSDIKAIGASRLAPHNRLGDLSDVLQKCARGECARSIDELKRFLDKAKRDSLVSGNFRHAVPLFEAKPMSEIEKLDNLQSFTRWFFGGHSKADPLGVDRAFDGVNSVHRAFEGALLSEGLRRGGLKEGGSGVAAKESAVVLWEAGISAEEALPLMLKGLDAQQVVGVVREGVEQSLSSGWL